MIGALLRVLSGFVLACLAAGAVEVLFVNTPAELGPISSAAFPDRAAGTAELALLAATHSAIFAAMFALVATGIGEWLALRSPIYYAAAGAAIALLGFFAQYSSEVAGQPTILNGYALAAFVTAGLAAGLVYWLASGRLAGRSRVRDDDIASGEASPRLPRIIVEKSPGETAPPGRGWAQRKSDRTTRKPAPDRAPDDDSRDGADDASVVDDLDEPEIALRATEGDKTAAQSTPERSKDRDRDANPTKGSRPVASVPVTKPAATGGVDAQDDGET